MATDRVSALADMSVARGCGFAGLGIFSTMVGLSFDPALAFRVGGVLCLAMSAVLWLKAHRAPVTSHRRTELWVLLDKEERPPDAIAQPVIAGARRWAFLRWADISARVAVGLLVGSAVLWFLAPG